MSEPKGMLKKYSRAIVLFIVAAVIIYLIATNIGVFGKILLVILGFGAVVLVHEFGHFIVAKMSGVKVEAFSIGFSPVFFGVLRTEKGFRIRVLPGVVKSEEGSESDGSIISFTIPKKGKAGETEYRVGLIPFGGFVKMLGQEDTGTAEVSDDPRSFINKTVGARAAIIVAGVTFNAISAVVIFMVAFLVGIHFSPPIVGDVVFDSPAARAGIMAGDEIVEINGKTKDLDFSNIGIAAALCDVNESINLTVKRNGELKEFSIKSRKQKNGDLRVVGVYQPLSLQIAQVSDPNELLRDIGLLPFDKIKSVNGKDVEYHWDLMEIVKNALTPHVTVLAVRKDADNTEGFVEAKLPLYLSATKVADANKESQLHDICSMVPRLMIAADANKPAPAQSFFDRIFGKKSQLQQQSSWVKRGDVIISAGGVENPTYVQLRKVTIEHVNEELTLKIERVVDGTPKVVAITGVPKMNEVGRVVLGIMTVLDDRSAVVAATIGDNKLKIPAGSKITRVDGVEVSNFYDVIAQLRKNAGQKINVDYRVSDEVAGSVVFVPGENGLEIDAESSFAVFVPFDNYKKLYKATGPIDAIVMGVRKTVMFITQSYLTLKSVISGLVSPKLLMGPVGILTFSYKIVAQQPFIYYVYFLGLINACIAVMNLLPLLPFDGGVLVVLLVEKIKGSPINEKIQAVVTNAGLVLVGLFFLYVTFNDIVRGFFQ
ncbi:MAG: site-2 protease family protein [Phycisphaerae bacterium]|nr:site-2 protease family protein [Phycisphaerae bacterium]